MTRMLRTTVIGGILFLVPLAFVLIVVNHAWHIAVRVAKPFHKFLPADTISGELIIALLTFVVVLVVCFLAGLAARQSVVARRMARLDGLLMDGLPGYAVAKSTLGGIVRADEIDAALTPVEVRFDDHSLLAFEIERSGDRVAVFLPGSPAAWSGSALIVEAERVRQLSVPVHEVNRVLRVLGRGTFATLDAEEPEQAPQA